MDVLDYPWHPAVKEKQRGEKTVINEHTSLKCRHLVVYDRWHYIEEVPVSGGQYLRLHMLRSARPRIMGLGLSQSFLSVFIASRAMSGFTPANVTM